jgi:ferredoxin-type protein NapH
VALVFSAYAKKRYFTQFFMGILFIGIIIAGWSFPLLGFFIPLCMLLGLSLGAVRGRKWCDWYCPRGSFYDAAMNPLRMRKKIPLLFKDMRFRVFVLSLLMLVMAFNLVMRWPSVHKIGQFFIMMLSVTTALGVVLAIFFHQRSWCTICPIGTMINLVGKRKHPLYINSAACNECKMCEKVCPTQIAAYGFKKEGTQVVLDGDCLKCDLCVRVCPQQALSREQS